jgi:N-acetylneuraminic acid mutarotase
MRAALAAFAAAALVAAVVVVVALGSDDDPTVPARGAATDRWLPLASARLERSEVAAARIGRSIYVAGGFERTSGGATSAAVERYDIRHDSWRRVRSMPLGLNHAVAATHGGRLYVSGGYSSPSGLANPTRVLLEYDPSRDSWRRLRPAHTPRAAHAAAVIGDRLYIAGGANDSGSLRSLEIYDFERRRWRSGPSFPAPARNHTTGVASGGRFYVLAGRDDENFTATARYDPRRRRWRRLPAMRTARGGIASARLRDGRIVVFGGEDLSPGGTTIRQVELFNPRTRRWRSLPGMRTPRHGLGGAALGNRVYALEGGPQPRLHFSSALEFLDVR